MEDKIARADSELGLRPAEAFSEAELPQLVVVAGSAASDRPPTLAEGSAALALALALPLALGVGYSATKPGVLAAQLAPVVDSVQAVALVASAAPHRASVAGQELPSSRPFLPLMALEARRLVPSLRRTVTPRG